MDCFFFILQGTVPLNPAPYKSLFLCDCVLKSIYQDLKVQMNLSVKGDSSANR